MATQFVERMAVETDGSGDDVLLIHGLGGTSNVWMPLMPTLMRHRTVRPDLPGSGRSARVEGPLTIDRFVQRLLGSVPPCMSSSPCVAHSLARSAFPPCPCGSPLVRSLTLFGPLCRRPHAGPGLKARAIRRAAKAEAGMQAIAEGIVRARPRANPPRQPAAVACA